LSVWAPFAPVLVFHGKVTGPRDSVEGGDGAAPAALDAGRDEGDQERASEQTEIALMTRERLIERMERLTAALARVSAGRYGHCVVCGRRIAAPRLAAIPETETCVSCQEQREGRTPGIAA
jgi:RNA polymerase-binding transcription factor DksA